MKRRAKAKIGKAQIGNTKSGKAQIASAKIVKPKSDKTKSGKVKSSKAAAGILAETVRSAPVPIAPKKAQARIDAWLDSLAPARRSSLRSLFKANPRLLALLRGLSEHSPFLWDLICADAGRLLRILRADPEKHLKALLARAIVASTSSRDEAALMTQLRRMRAEAALLIALTDIGGIWPVMRTTHALTELADTAVAAAVRYLLAEAHRDGRLTLPDPTQPEQGSGYIVLAMGKMGGHELNYSSDIDLIVFYDPQAPAVSGHPAPGQLFVKITQRLVKILSERTGDGYVFRTDLRLRPDPASTAIAISFPAALSYYESAGQNWERAAMIKARVCAGDAAAGATLLDALSPFIWRKYLDYAAVASVRAMKQQIHAYRGHSEIAVEGHNIKLGRGGIREIEFFAQTQQLIAGGRDSQLRERETLAVLDQLVESRWIDARTRAEMRDAYLFLRTVEHRIQMVNDEQTHTLPDAPDAVDRLARFLGYRSRDAFAKILTGHLANVQRNYGKLFEVPAGNGDFNLVFPPDHDDRNTLDRLNELGFKGALEASATIRNWLAGGKPALRSEFARDQIAGLLPAIVEHLSKTANPDATLLLFDRFLDNLKGGGRLLSLLRQNPTLIGLMATILGTAPRLAETLAHYPDVMDALVDPDFFGALPGRAVLEQRLAAAIDGAGFDQDLLERLRMFALEQMFLIGVRVLTGTVSAAQAGDAFAQLAEVAVSAVHRAVGEVFAVAHGHIRGEATAVVAMGKLGGSEMTATSDLDLIVIYDFDETNPESDGPRKLYGAQYFARFTQRLVNALTAQTNYGVLYQVDMRLRPSGRSGPVATRLESFREYQRSEAWTWEHMALTRARVVSAPPRFAARIEEAIREVLIEPRDRARIAADVVNMRGAIAADKGEGERWDIKYVAGGLIDIEFIAQYLQLVHAHALPGILDTNTVRVLEKARRLGALAAEDAEVLVPAVRLYQNLTQVMRLCVTGPFEPGNLSAELMRLLALAGDVPDFATLEATLAETQLAVRACFVRILGGAPVARELSAGHSS